MSTERKFPAKLGQPVVKPSAKETLHHNLTETGVVVSTGGDTYQTDPNPPPSIVEISSDSSGDEEELDQDVLDDFSDFDADEGAPNGQDVEMEDAVAVQEDECHSPLPEDMEELGEPSFGDLVVATTSEVIDVASAFPDVALPVAYPKSTELQIPSGGSLGTVLSQALRTNDLGLLESCLSTSDIPTIRATIQRLDSPLAGALLQKLAERLHRRPGRAGSLMVWVQWTLVTHGGHLATQPNLAKKLAELNRVIGQRAKGLQSLLSLKGKLDMLEAQMQLRRALRQQQNQEEEDEEGGVIYVEGEDDDASSDVEQEDLLNGTRSSQSRGRPNGISGDQSDISETRTLISNGIIPDSDAAEEEEDEDDDDESSEADHLIDDEADETDADSAEEGDEDEVDHSDVDEIEEDESDDAAPPPPKRKR